MPNLKFKSLMDFSLHLDVHCSAVLRGQLSPRLHRVAQPLLQAKFYIPSTINTWQMFWHTIWGLVCSKMVNHGLSWVILLAFQVFVVKIYSRLT